jgi:uncharacterized membrane protein SpoIIM required for sporulation
MKIFGRELVGFAKALVVLIAVLLVSAGMCGLQLAIRQGSQGDSGAILIPLGIVELIAMLVSAAGIVLVLLAWGTRALYRLIRDEPDTELQQASRDESPVKHDEDR